MTRKHWRDLAYVLVLACVGALVVAWWHELAALWRQHALTFAGAVLMMMLAMVMQARNFLSFLDVRADIALVRLAGIWGTTALLNYAGPLQPGVVARVAYLRAHGVDPVVSILATLRQLCASVWLALAGLSLGLFAMSDGRTFWVAAASMAMFLGVLGLWNWRAWMLAAGVRLLRLQRHQDLLARALAGMSISGVLGVSVQYLIGVLVLLWVYPRFGVDMGVGEALVLACVVYVSALVAVLPANFGVLDGIYALGGHQLGLGLQEAAALALLLRAAHITACLLLLPLARHPR